MISSVGVYGNRIFFDQIKGKVSTVLSFNFEGIDEGLNPHGGSFNIQEVKSEEVLEATIEQLGLSEKGIDANVLAGNIVLKGVVPEDVMDRILPSMSGQGSTQFAAVSNMTYHPTQYALTLYIDRDMKLSKKEAQEVVSALVENYRTYFVEKYKDVQILEAAILTIDPSQYDYAEYITIVRGKLQTLKQYLEAKEKVARGFESHTTGYGFADLISGIEFIEDVEMSNIQALIDAFMITRDKEELIAVYENRIYNMKRDKDKYLKEAQKLRETANSYEKDPTMIVGDNSIISLKEDETKDKDKKDKDKKEEIDLYEDIVQKTVEADNKANKLTYQIKHYENLLAKLHASASDMTSTALAAYTEEVEKGITNLASSLSEMMTKIEQTVNDYYEQEVFERSIEQMTGVTYQSAMRMNLIKDIVLIGGITGLAVLLAVVYLLLRKEEK